MTDFMRPSETIRVRHCPQHDEPIACKACAFMRMDGNGCYSCGYLNALAQQRLDMSALPAFSPTTAEIRPQRHD